MLKKFLFVCVSLLIAGSVFADSVQTVIEINGVEIGNGSVYVVVYSNENDYKNETPFLEFILQPDNTNLVYSVDLPEGDYVVSAFQDADNDGEVKCNVFGIPTEHVGKTGYSLRGAPGGFQRLKVSINNNSTRLIVNMGRVKALGIF
jgi:uncharacterized protein (DUF2141 family)